MSELKITFTLSDSDVSHLRKMMRKAGAAAKDLSDDAISHSVRSMAKSAREAKPPTYVIERIEKLETVVEMTQDKDWALPASVKKKVIAALAYFTNPADLIPDQIPGLGFLDDAIMIELVAQDLRHEIKAYRDFGSFRDSAEQRPWTTVGKSSLEKRLQSKRKQLRARIQERYAKDEARGTKSGFRLW